MIITIMIITIAIAIIIIICLSLGYQLKTSVENCAELCRNCQPNLQEPQNQLQVSNGFCGRSSARFQVRTGELANLAKTQRASTRAQQCEHSSSRAMSNIIVITIIISANS